MDHERLARLARPMNTTDRILGEAMTPRQKRIYKDAEKATAWAIKHQQRFPEAEPYIATDPWPAYNYAVHIIDGRWPEAEATIATDPNAAHAYARDVIKGRFPEGEAAIAKDPIWAKEYLERFPEAKHYWVMRGWLDWFDI